jgi:Putative Ig domain/Pentapeptide repeats (8 copies)
MGSVKRKTGWAVVAGTLLVGWATNSPPAAAAPALGASLAATPATSCTIVITPTPTDFTDCPGYVFGEEFQTGTNDMDYADLAGATMTRSNSSNETYDDANLSGLDWFGTFVEGSTFTDADMAGIDFDDGVLSGATFAGANLTDANLTLANLGGDPGFPAANLDGANLDGANLDGAQIAVTDPVETNFTGATFNNATFTDTVLVPSDQTVAATSPDGATVSWSTPPSAPGASPGTCSQASGTVFPVGTTTVTCDVDDGSGGIGTGTFTVNVTGTAPAITSSDTATLVANSAASINVTSTGTPTPQVSIAGNLPQGLTYTANGAGGGTISGTPTTGSAGVSAVTLTASNGVSPDATQTLTFTVDLGPAITSPNSELFVVGGAGDFTVRTTGYPNPAITEAGALPSGVSLVDNGDGTATLSGTPASGSGGTYPIAITAHNGVGADATQTFTLTVNQTPAITSAGTATFTSGVGGTFTVESTGSPVPSLTETPTLPAGTTFTDKGDGTATLTVGASTAPGTYDLNLTATNGVTPNATQAFTLTVLTPVSVTGSLPGGTVGTPYLGTLQATGGVPPYNWSLASGALPRGLSLATDGTISGTPTSIGTFRVTVRATDASSPPSVATAVDTITIAQAPWAGPAATGIPDPAGKNAQGFYVGVKGETWRLEVTQRRWPANAYSGTVTINAGSFSNVTRVRLETDDQLSHTAKTISFKFSDNSGIDGVSFTTPDTATTITFNLAINGKKVTTSEVFLGLVPHGHPSGAPFTVRRAS